MAQLCIRNTIGETIPPRMSYMFQCLSNVKRKYLIDGLEIKTPYLGNQVKINEAEVINPQSGNPYVYFKPEAQRPPIRITIPPPRNNIKEEIEHLEDYGSEDIDYYVEDIRAQHYIRKGSVFPSLLLLAFPAIFIVTQLFYPKMPHENFFKKPTPPPLDFPDSEISPDTLTLEKS